ncbi:bacteriorhodopsin [Rhizosaccharibacter radicis]|uniref:Bacteriorhodopsin n=1 Tax=Rhizosaccharibacter radicis TaxID=2782605 RepID=A0ABT1VT19_9PROT|nr:bacteriorhodopsin [Acetobacteraceae bacterium KSS12]
MTDSFWLWIGCIGMAVGAAAIFLIGGRKTADEETGTILHGTVPVIAACAYFAMAVGQGSLPWHSVQNGQTISFSFYFARYIDWLFTTPILLASLALTASHGRVRRAGPLVGILLADVLMIVTALFFGMSTTGWIKWTWFVISCGAFFAVYYVLLVGLREEAARQRADVQAAYTRNATFLSVIWFIYPVVLLLEPEGLAVIGSTLSCAIIVVIDLVSKVVYGLMTTVGHRAIAERDLREGA